MGTHWKNTSFKKRFPPPGNPTFSKFGWAVCHKITLWPFENACFQRQSPASVSPAKTWRGLDAAVVYFEIRLVDLVNRFSSDLCKIGARIAPLPMKTNVFFENIIKGACKWTRFTGVLMPPMCSVFCCCKSFGPPIGPPFPLNLSFWGLRALKMTLAHRILMFFFKNWFLHFSFALSCSSGPSWPP